MIEKLPRLGSKRFREILWPALRGRPLAAATGLWWLLTRRRVRGWSRLLIAASEAPYDYARWIGAGEPRAFVRFRDEHPARYAIEVIPVILAGAADPKAVQTTLLSLRAVFGNATPIYSTSEQTRAGDQIRVEPTKSLENLGRYSAEEIQARWLLFVLAGDRVSPLILDAVQRACGDRNGAPIIYWDEDTFGPNGRQEPWIKPDWNSVLFEKLGGLTGSSVVRFASIQAVVNGALDNQKVEKALLAIAASKDAPKPTHIPLVLTHRDRSNALGVKDDRISDDFSKTSWPTVSVIIPTRDRADLLVACITGLRRTPYPKALDLIVIDNGSTEAAAVQILEDLKEDPHVRVIHDPRPFNFSQLNNGAAAVAVGDYLCFLNNDVETIEDDWLKRMVSKAMGGSIGAVGAMLLYPSGRIQHAGIALGVGGAAGHVQKGVMPSEQRFWTWHRVTREVSAVTAAVMVIRKSKFFEVGGFDADSFPVAFNDVDLCLRLNKAGYRNLYVADARLIHRESESRGDDRHKKNAERYARELSILQERWNTKEAVDPHFSVLFSRSVERCVLIP